MVSRQEEFLELGAGAQVGGERAGESVFPEAEDAEVGQVSDGVGGDLAGEPGGGEAELDDLAGGVVAGDTEPGAWGWVGLIPLPGAATDGGAEAEQGGSVVGGGGGEEEE